MPGQSNNNPYHYNRNGHQNGGPPPKRRMSNGYNGNYQNNNNHHNNNQLNSVHHHQNGIGVGQRLSAAQTNGLSPNQYRSLRARTQLPVYRTRGRIIEALQKDQTLIFISETASGKTTQIPQFIYEAKLNRGLCVAITQPRRVAATSVARRVAEEIRTELGHVVGYSVRFEQCVTDKTMIKFMTDGMLLREAISDPSLSRYSVIILDEAHERSINTDILFGIVKRAQRLRQRPTTNGVSGSGSVHPPDRTLKVVIMSATMDVDHFSQYFDGAPVYSLSGRQFDVQLKYLSEPVEDYVEAALITVFQIHMNEEDGDILVFCTGQEEIEAMVGYTIATSKQLPAGSKRLFAWALHASLPHHQQLKALEPSQANTRKVIYATNVAETSLTIQGVRYVVDTGKVKCRNFNASTGFETLKIESISQAQASQRAGRAGRQMPGVCYRLMTEEQYAALPPHSTPYILRCNLASVVLELIAIGIGDIRGFEFMDRPNEENLKAAIDLLQLFKAIEPDTLRTNLLDAGGDSKSRFKLTALGSQMIRYPLDPRLARCLVASKDLGCSEELLTIIAMMSIESIFHVTIDKRDQAIEAHKKFQSTEGDHIQLLNIWLGWQNSKCNPQWCRDNFINIRSLTMARDIRNQLIKLFDSSGNKRQSCRGQTEVLRKCLALGYRDQMATLQRDGTYRSGKLEVQIHPSSCLLRLKPEHLLYSELVQTTKLFMRTISVVDPNWIS